MKALSLFQYHFGRDWWVEPSYWQQRSVAVLCEAKSVDTQTTIKATLPKRPEADVNGNPIPKPEIKKGVAVIPIKGALGKSVEPVDKWIFGDWDYDDIAEDIETVVREGAKSGVLLINSPGGMVIGLSEAIETIRLAPIPLVAFTDTWATSAAYALAVSAKQFLVTPSAITGSIGCIMQRPDMTGLLEFFGVKVETFTSGDLKGAFNVNKPMTDAQKEWAQGFVEKDGAAFRAFVKERMPKATDDMMRGQVFYGDDAVKNGMAHGLVRNLSDAIKVAQSLAS